MQIEHIAIWTHDLEQPRVPPGIRHSAEVTYEASPRLATSLEAGLATVERLLADAAAQGTKIVCFPEAYLPSLRGQDFEVLPFELPQALR